MTVKNSRFQPRSIFLGFALSEGVTWALLISGLIIKATIGAPQQLLTVVGGIHGASVVGVNQRWGILRTVAAVALAIVPFATVPFERHLDRDGFLVGSWRTESTNDPRDSHWFDRLFRWFIARPTILIGSMIFVVIAIFAGLLLIGPPGGWPKAE
jgi:integral membrane protein